MRLHSAFIETGTAFVVNSCGINQTKQPQSYKYRSSCTPGTAAAILH
jgi:hypothetical protein